MGGFVRVDDIFQMVKRAITAGRPAHGYLIVGPVRGVAMDLTLRILKMLFCQDEKDKPCENCEGCRRVTERIEPDVHWVFPEKKSRVISAEQIRDRLLYEMTQTAFAGGWKVGVLVGADRLNDASANAFLKTLEEPPEKTLFLLLSDTPQHLLPTILSRCQRIDLAEVRELDEPWKSQVIETLASPFWGRSLENLAMSNMLYSFLADMKERAASMVVDESKDETKIDEDDDVFDAKINARYREIRTDFLLTLMRWFRDLFVLQAGGDNNLVYNSSKLLVLKERSSRLTLSKAIYNLNAIEELTRQMEKNLSEETVLAYAMDRLSHGVV